MKILTIHTRKCTEFEKVCLKGECGIPFKRESQDHMNLFFGNRNKGNDPKQSC